MNFIIKVTLPEVATQEEAEALGDLFTRVLDRVYGGDALVTIEPESEDESEETSCRDPQAFCQHGESLCDLCGIE